MKKKKKKADREMRSKIIHFKKIETATSLRVKNFARGIIIFIFILFIKHWPENKVTKVACWGNLIFT